MNHFLLFELLRLSGEFMIRCTELLTEYFHVETGGCV